MCAVCWDRPFCVDDVTGAITQRASADAPCLGGQKQSAQASRIISATTRTPSGSFHCVQPPGANLNPTAVDCPADDAARNALKSVNKCVDVPVQCRDPLNFSDCSERADPAGPACLTPSATPSGDERFACGAGNDRTIAIPAAREKLIGRAATWGLSPPSGIEPARYCYLNCVGHPCPTNPSDWSCAPSCSDFNSPAVLAESIPARVDPSSSSARIVVYVGGKVFDNRLQIAGDFALDTSPECRGPIDGDRVGTCTARLSYMNLGSLGSMQVAERQVQNLNLLLPDPVTGSALASGDNTVVALGSGVAFQVSSDVQGYGHPGKLYETQGTILVGLNWRARTFDVLTVVTDSTGSSTLALALHGSLRNLPPLADAGGDRRVECTSPSGTSVTLSAAASHDPDGAADLIGYDWTWARDGVERTASGVALTTDVPIGETAFSVTVTDRATAKGSARAVITVVDSTGPSLTGSSSLFFEACDSTGAVVEPAAPTVQDACGAAAIVDARVVDINGTPTNQLLTSGYRFRQGETVIEYTATDTHGNRTTFRQVVALDRGPSCCPANLSLVLGTDGTDTLTGGNHRQCIAGLGGADTISGGNQSDVIFAGPGNDVCYGGNSNDPIYGGIGDDTIDASNGKDAELWGGPGDDQIVGGAGKDRIRGGAGRDNLYGGKGDDVFIIAAACEVPAGEVIDGGEGTDRIESPLTRAELEARGVIIRNVEEFVLTPVLLDAECVDP